MTKELQRARRTINHQPSIDICWKNKYHCEATIVGMPYLLCYLRVAARPGMNQPCLGRLTWPYTGLLAVLMSFCEEFEERHTGVLAINRR